MRIDDFEHWARGNGLEIVLFALGSVLLARVVRWSGDRLIARSQAKTEPLTELGILATERHKHTSALLQVGTWTSIGLIYFIACLMIVQRFNVPLTSLVAPATVAGAAIGFGAQRVVQDLLSGFFIFAEHQFGYGDIVEIAPPGQAGGATGVVEEMTLRSTKLRTVKGELVVIPNGEIRQLTNLSKDWARVVLDIPLPAYADVARASDILQRIAGDISDDEQWRHVLLDRPSIMGIEQLTLDFQQLRFVARTLPAKQWEVGRELRGRIAAAFRDAGMSPPPAEVAGAGGVR